MSVVVLRLPATPARRFGRTLLCGCLLAVAAAQTTQAQGPGGGGAAQARQAVEDRAFERRKTSPKGRVGAGFSGVAIGDEQLAAVVVEGNRTIPEHAILSRVLSQAGRYPYDQQIKDDLRALYETRWFKRVDHFLRQTPQGLTLVFRVTEAPIVGRVQFVGNDKLSTKN